jgi:very-short-patch-repair endonuclease
VTGHSQRDLSPNRIVVRCITPCNMLLSQHRTMPRRSIPTADALAMKVAAEQFGLINARQLRACGLNKQAVHRRVQAGRLLTLLPTVYRLGGTKGAPLEPIMAAVLWAGEGAVASHVSSAQARGLDGFVADSPHISVTGGLKSAYGIVVHRIAALEDADITNVGPIPVTSGPRMLLELASARDRRIEKALDQMLREGRVELSRIWLLLDRPEMCGRKGTKALRRLLEQRTAERAPTQSEMEDLFKRIVRKYRLPVPEQQYPFALNDSTIHLDFAYPQAAIAIECDGYAWHMNRQAFERDRLRDIELQVRGWVVLRFTWSMLRWRQAYVAAQVRHQLATRTQLSL